MQVAYSLADLCQSHRSFTLLQSLIGLYNLVKRPLLHVLHQYVEVHCIMEEPIKFDHIRMGEKEANLQLLDELL